MCALLCFANVVSKFVSEVEEVPLLIRVIQKGGNPISWGTQYGNVNDPTYIDTTYLIEQGVCLFIRYTFLLSYFFRKTLGFIFHCTPRNTLSSPRAAYKILVKKS